MPRVAVKPRTADRRMLDAVLDLLPSDDTLFADLVRQVESRAIELGGIKRSA